MSKIKTAPTLKSINYFTHKTEIEYDGQVAAMAGRNLVFGYRIQTNSDYTNDNWDSYEDYRDKCVSHLREWFEGLPLKNQIGIFYSHKYYIYISEQFVSGKNTEREFNQNDGRHCPFQNMVFDAQHNAYKEHAPWVLERTTEPNYHLELIVMHAWWPE